MKIGSKIFEPFYTFIWKYNVPSFSSIETSWRPFAKFIVRRWFIIDIWKPTGKSSGLHLQWDIHGHTVDEINANLATKAVLTIDFLTIFDAPLSLNHSISDKKSHKLKSETLNSYRLLQELIQRTQIITISSHTESVNFGPFRPLLQNFIVAFLIPNTIVSKLLLTGIDF
jgi:hypothetical protein